MRVSKCLLIMAVLFPSAALAQPAPKPGTPVAFKACPIFTGIEGGCWLAIHNGVVYGLGGAATTPMKGLTIVVRGVVANKAHFCPGLVLDPIMIEVTRQKCTPPMWPLANKK